MVDIKHLQGVLAIGVFEAACFAKSGATSTPDNIAHLRVKEGRDTLSLYIDPRNTKAMHLIETLNYPQNNIPSRHIRKLQSIPGKVPRKEPLRILLPLGPTTLLAGSVTRLGRALAALLVVGPDLLP